MAVKKVRNHGQWRWRTRVVFRGRQRVAYRLTKDEAKAAEVEFYRALREEVEREARAGQLPATLRALLDLYVERLERQGKRADTVARARDTVKTIGRVLPALLDRPVSAIGADDVFDFARAREREGQTVAEVVAGERRERRVDLRPSTVNRDLTTLRAALKLVRPEFRFPREAFGKHDDTRVRWLRPEEEILVFDAMPSPCREIAQLAALTLMRLSEIRTLRREQVRLEQGVIELPRTKTGPRHVILSAAAQKILRGQREAHPDGEWVFPNPDGRPYSRVHVSRVFRKAARAAGLRDFHFHDLRHHGATMALNKGFTAPVVMALGGWKSEGMMRRYAAVTDPTLRAAAEAVSGAEGTAWARLVVPPAERLAPRTGAAER